MMSLSTALSALRANQIAMDVVGHNIANTNTTGFHRQEARFATKDSIEIYGHRVGQGVEIAEIRRSFDAATEDAILKNIADLNATETQLSTASKIESLLSPGQGTVIDAVESFFEELQLFTAHSQDASSRSLVVQSAQRIVEETSRVSSELSSITEDIDKAIEQAMREIEDLSKQIIDIDIEIKTAKHRGQSPNALLDRRGQILRDLAELIDVEVEQQLNYELDNGIRQDFYRLAGGFLTFSKAPLDLETRVTPDGTLLISRVGRDREFPVTSGRLGGLLSARNELANKFTNELGDFATGLVTRLDTIHATGVGLSDGYSNAVGRRSVDDITVPLGQLDTLAPIEAGSLFVNVIDPDGAETLHEVTVDPSSQSASDLAAAISAIPNVSAVISAEAGQLNIAAAPGYQFNFTGRLPTDLSNTSSIAGTFSPKLTGLYTGTDNMDISFRFSGPGEIGNTVGLQLEVLNAAGGVVDTFNVGAGYAGTELRIAEGVNLALMPGSVNAGDTFSTTLIAEPDTTNVLAAFGINSLFTGTDVSDFAVSSAVQDDPSLLAVRNFGEPLDTAKRMLEVRDERFLANNSQTAHEFLTDIITSVGTDTLELTQTQENLMVAGDALAAKEQGLSGVDPNEEMVRMLQYQRAFQSVARYIATVEETLDELFNILR